MRHGCQFTEEELSVRFRKAYADHFCDAATDESMERKRWRSVVADVFHLTGNALDSLFEELWEHFADHRHWAVYDEVADLWQRLHERQFQLGIASNFDARLHKIAARLVPLDQAVEVFCSSQIGFGKPSPQFFESIEEQLGLAPHELLLVGDDLNRDFAAARSAGWHAVHLARGSHPTTADSIRSLAELK